MRNHGVRLLAPLLALALLGGSTSLPAAQAGTVPGPLVSAHRGGAAYAPENTMPAFDNAVRLGVDQLETDTQLTADGRLVLLHDDRLDRTTDCTGTVASRTWAEIEPCDAAYWWTPGQGVTVPDPTAPHPLRGDRRPRPAG